MVIMYHSTMVGVSTRGPTWSVAPFGTFAASLVSFTNTLSVGVPIFFVISGYCIAAAAESVRLGRHGIARYFVRRFRRIYPPLWIFMACGVAFFIFDYVPVRGALSDLPWMQPRPWWYWPSQWIGNITLTETWRSHVWGGFRAHFPGQAWTLCYEEQFYLVVGLLLTLRRSAFFVGATVITILTVLVVAVAPKTAIDGFFFDGSWLLFVAGVAVYYQLLHAQPVAARFLQALLILSVVTPWLIDIPHDNAIGFAFAALLPILRPYDRWMIDLPIWRTLAVPGRMCYSLYLVHQLPVKAISMATMRWGVRDATGTLLVTLPICVAASLALGWLFHVAVERRFLNDKMAVSTAATQPIAAVS